MKSVGAAVAVGSGVSVGPAGKTTASPPRSTAVAALGFTTCTS